MKVPQSLRISNNPLAQQSSKCDSTCSSSKQGDVNHVREMMDKIESLGEYSGEKVSLSKNQSCGSSYRKNSNGCQEQLREAAFKNLRKLFESGGISASRFEMFKRALCGGPATDAKRISEPAKPLPTPTPASDKTASYTPAQKEVSSNKEAASNNICKKPPSSKNEATPDLKKPGSVVETAKKEEPVKVSEQEVFDVLWNKFTLFATASGKGQKDNISRDDLKAILNQPGISDQYKNVAKFLLQNKAAFNALEVRSGQNGHDGQMSWWDLRDACVARNLGHKLWQ